MHVFPKAVSFLFVLGREFFNGLGLCLANLSRLGGVSRIWMWLTFLNIVNVTWHVLSPFLSFLSPVKCEAYEIVWFSRKQTIIYKRLTLAEVEYKQAVTVCFIQIHGSVKKHHEGLAFFHNFLCKYLFFPSISQTHTCMFLKTVSNNNIL